VVSLSEHFGRDSANSEQIRFRDGDEELQETMKRQLDAATSRVAQT
jgi:hypothetical protein